MSTTPVEIPRTTTGVLFITTTQSRMVRLDEDEEDRYVYDGLNRRVVKYGSEGNNSLLLRSCGTPSHGDVAPRRPTTVPTGRTTCIWTAPDRTRRLVGDATSGDPPNPGIVVTSEKELFYYHADELGTPIMMTDGSAAPVWKAEYLPFGGCLPTLL